MSVPTFERQAPVYARLWRMMEIGNARTPQASALAVLDKAASRLIANMPRYKAVEAKTNVPAAWVAIIHEREATGNFGGILANGEHIIGTGRKTRLVPEGRGPFSSWEEAAIDEIRRKGLHKIGLRNWTVERYCFHAEEWNGWGSYFKGVRSSYLWAMSNLQQPGKWVADHEWSSTFWDPQVGCMPLLKRMMALDHSIQFGDGGSAVTVKDVVVAGGAAAAGAAGAATVSTTTTSSPPAPSVPTPPADAGWFAHWTWLDWIVAAVIAAAIAYALFVLGRMAWRAWRDRHTASQPPAAPAPAVLEEVSHVDANAGHDRGGPGEPGHQERGGQELAADPVQRRGAHDRKPAQDGVGRQKRRRRRNDPKRARRPARRRS